MDRCNHTLVEVSPTGVVWCTRCEDLLDVMSHAERNSLFRSLFMSRLNLEMELERELGNYHEQPELPMFAEDDQQNEAAR